jgi:hypothetical protein
VHEPGQDTPQRLATVFRGGTLRGHAPNLRSLPACGATLASALPRLACHGPDVQPRGVPIRMRSGDRICCQITDHPEMWPDGAKEAC